ncbi:unnamed protein product, partial [Discosporangium mesarthrocarpum]
HGYAGFPSLRIDKAGVGYRLGFNISFELEGGYYVESEAFTVGVGPAHQLRFDANPLNSTIFSGVPFREQPRVRACDLGGNTLTGDSESGILVSIATNP